MPAPGLPACAPHWVTVTRLHAPPPPPHQDKKESKKHKKEKKEKKEKKGKKEKKRDKERAKLAVTASGSEWGKYGIRVNAIAPGYFPSKMTAGTLKKHQQSQTPICALQT